MKHIKLFESFINEGGGSGIDFKIENVTFSANLIITNGSVKIENSKLELPSTFDAKGYQEGLSNVKTDILGVESSNLNISWDKLKNSKLTGFNVNNDEMYEEIFSKEGENFSPDMLEHLSTLEDLFKILPNATLNVTIDYDLDYSTMKFAGYSRGSFEVGEVFSAAHDYNGDYTNTYIEDIKIDELNFEAFSFPKILVTEDFINFYNDVFNHDDNFDEDEDDSHDYYLYLKDTYCE